MKKNLSENEIIMLARQGDQDAYGWLFGEYSTLIKSIARKYFLLGADIDDLTQEGMIGFASAINSYAFSSPATFKTFAGICIKRAVIDLVRKHSSQKNKLFADSIALDPTGKITDDSTDGVMIVLPSAENGVENKLIWLERLSEIKQFIVKTLSSFEKQVLTLYLQGLSHNEIAQKLDKDVPSIENAISRIRKKLAPIKTNKKIEN